MKGRMNVAVEMREEKGNWKGLETPEEEEE